ncbi:hypothetical protein ACR1PO_08200 [Chryseobacterium sp. RRHN12]|uniref:hypothetical protein n=1 Tax=Chryseobacterium sp. RRHN12 TaxID=3437884 RepID=UPI003D9BC09B
MFKYIVLLVTGTSYIPINGQVGVNNPSPNVTLEITAKKTDGSRPEGVIYTCLSGDALYDAGQNGVYGQKQDGAMTFVTAAPLPEKRVGQTIDIDARGYYYYDYPANKWIKMHGFNTAAAAATTLNCTEVTRIGNLRYGIATSGVSFELPYSGGNGSNYNAQEIVSTGVMGLKATLPAGTIAVGSGKLTFTISGTPDRAGTATFPIDFGGKHCEITMVVANPNPVATGLNCAGVIKRGYLTEEIAASGVSFELPYSGGNGADYSMQEIVSAGVMGLKATLPAGTMAVGNGKLTFIISGTPQPNSTGVAKFLINFAGKSCEISLNVWLNARLGHLNCKNIAITGTLTAGVAASAVSVSLPYVMGDAGNAGTYKGESIPSTGVTGLTATLADGLIYQAQNLPYWGDFTYTISGTPAGAGIANFPITVAGQSCTMAVPVGNPNTTAEVSNLNCTGSVITGTITDGIPVAAGVKFEIPYSGGNGKSYPEQSILSSTIVLYPQGLTAKLAAGTIAANGILTYTITGTTLISRPLVGNFFPVNFGGKNCRVPFTVTPRRPGDGF